MLALRLLPAEERAGCRGGAHAAAAPVNFPAVGQNSRNQIAFWYILNR
jgi:hypothetical protein